MNGVSALQLHQLLTQQVQSTQKLTQTSDAPTISTFGSLLSDQIKKTNDLQHRSDSEVQKFITGESENIHDMMIAMEEATIALEMTTQIRNKVIEVYQEFKNMQI